jgi:hypothetical protein
MRRLAQEKRYIMVTYGSKLNKKYKGDEKESKINLLI